MTTNQPPLELWIICVATAAVALFLTIGRAWRERDNPLVGTRELTYFFFGAWVGMVILCLSFRPQQKVFQWSLRILAAIAAGILMGFPAYRDGKAARLRGPQEAPASSDTQPD